ncbi:glutamine amidotransferase [Cupriavidus oxalaticus]|jgi:GMP synthase (glutamine-hydrolysing)|uniref:Glutamine amidotransferase n=1 Tax=Cupriavidus oxalaticus TaxID=96344 RepID=A0A976BAN0_9BURK|nr:glutamine amidotransferase [Cupriavidus oxalaticus]QRQ88930.1 glutamine amidotransferase [Cupriavidus oxalaticus]QRQ92744.1 glutamine amidotransferase [Cupriavidus oxalaticus]WQD81349.1 glutamine amidotransferase [Cupriavidus oxalaticus]SPC12645.1 Glutamine amidotransferase [Cupriavidus oxalaticus]
MATRTTHVIQHLAFEHAGVIGNALRARGHALRVFQAGVDDLRPIADEPADLLLILGGPIGVYETDAYPWLEGEIALIRQRLAAGGKMIGVCLGAQLIARAAGARVYPGTREIGWAPIEPTPAGRDSALGELAAASWEVLHWHGDTFDLPPGAELLASTAAVTNQAYAIGNQVLALQFHPEVMPGDIEAWLIGHTVELGKAGIDPRAIRARTAEVGAGVAAAGERMFGRWLEQAGL